MKFALWARISFWEAIDQDGGHRIVKRSRIVFPFGSAVAVPFLLSPIVWKRNIDFRIMQGTVSLRNITESWRNHLARQRCIEWCETRTDPGEDDGGRIEFHFGSAAAPAFLLSPIALKRNIDFCTAHETVAPQNTLESFAEAVGCVVAKTIVAV